MSKQLLVELKQKQFSLELKEKDLAQIVGIKKRNMVIGLAMVVGGLFLAFIFSELTSSEGIPEVLVLTAIAGAILWYINRKKHKAQKQELDSVTSEIEKCKKEIIEVENN
jgi:hypothetical protein